MSAALPSWEEEADEDEGSFVLHVDVDAAFVQIEQLCDPSLRGKAVAIQQHQAIIAANAAAKAAGVKKHMAPAAAREALKSVGGRVAHVHCTPDGRVSYSPYREMAARLLRLLRGLPWATVVEKASIDECFVLLPPGGGAAAAKARAHEAKAAVLAQLGLVVSVGAAPNRLLSKLASEAAKPDGVRLVGDGFEVQRVLEQTPARRLPGYGGKAADAFERHGVRAASDLQRYTQAQLEQLFELKPAAAARLQQWCRGLDDTPVQERGPPKTLSVSMSLTWQLLPMHPAAAAAGVAPAGGAGSDKALVPLVVGKPDLPPRLRQLAAAMGGDLVERVLEDAAEEHRWPSKLLASLRAVGAGRDQSFTTRSGPFPAQALAAQQQQQRRQAAAQPSQAQQQQPSQQADALQEAVVGGLAQLLEQAAAVYPASATVVELQLGAGSFIAEAPAITRFFAAAGSPPKQQQQREQQREQTQHTQQHTQQREQPQHTQQQTQQREQQRERTQQAAPPEAQQHEGGEAGGVDLAAIDVREQRRILEQLEREQRQQQQQQQAHSSRGGGGGGRGKAGGRKRGAAGPPRGDARQPKINSFLQRK